ncbi:ABC transporter ATP-binding protein [Saccharopolyspora pogona]|uniref:ABC transporter ATP-binding protein n=1 Tax=Saccharopolyspora pogona TaxID=333966 RepID=UPI001CC23B75|nr:ATP-binding cassette domain-containing protein [Saccharopolyspora pogona]
MLDHARLALQPGRITALTGPSGSGKTTVLRAILGDLSPGLSITTGAVTVLGQDVFSLAPKQLQQFRRQHLAYVGQDPGAALNPTMRISALLAEAAGSTDRALLAATLDKVRLPHSYLRRRPGELSGGEQRRLALARAIARRVDVLAVDEPLAGLDAALRGEICGLLRRIAEEHGTTIVVSGHHVTALTELADDVVDLAPQRTAVPAPARAAAPGRREHAHHDTPLLRGESLGATIKRNRRALLNDVEFAAHQGRATAIIGASGAGKTTLARVLVGLHHECSGHLRLADELLPRRALRRSREQRRRLQLIPQDPLSTLNPNRTIGAALTRPLALHRSLAQAQRTTRIEELLAEVGLSADFAQRHPHELSGGQRQRVAIARALAAEPDILICDEITSALDAGTAASIVELIDRTCASRGLGVVVISHDLQFVRDFCDDVFVLHQGEVVETGPSARVLNTPEHPATAALLAKTRVTA